jgi:hypothetical protein
LPIAAVAIGFRGRLRLPRRLIGSWLPQQRRPMSRFAHDPLALSVSLSLAVHNRAAANRAPRPPAPSRRLVLSSAQPILDQPPRDVHAALLVRCRRGDAGDVLCGPPVYGAPFLHHTIGCKTPPNPPRHAPIIDTPARDCAAGSSKRNRRNPAPVSTEPSEKHLPESDHSRRYQAPIFTRLWMYASAVEGAISVNTAGDMLSSHACASWQGHRRPWPWWVRAKRPLKEATCWLAEGAWPPAAIRRGHHSNRDPILTPRLDVCVTVRARSGDSTCRRDAAPAGEGLGHRALMPRALNLLFQFLAPLRQPVPPSGYIGASPSSLRVITEALAVGRLEYADL